MIKKFGMPICRALMLRQPLLFLLFLAIGFSANGQVVQHLSTNFPGGMPGRPVITGVQRGTNSLTVTWDGPSGYYQLFAKPGVNSPWRALTTTYNLSRKANISLRYSNATFRVTGPAAQYGGDQLCRGCHSNVLSAQIHTPHAGAFSDPAFVALGGRTNSSCLPCHTLGFEVPTGFVSLSKTAELANVQCENCHGPAANHAANPGDPLVRPRVELAATVCGGCHTAAGHTTFDEWESSGHAQVVEDMNPRQRINSCGRCHSGSVRLSLLHGSPLPVGDANLGIVCADCHDPHREHVHTNVLNGVFAFTNVLTDVALTLTNTQLGLVYTNQLRNPLNSTRDYFLTPTDVFAKKYDPSINLCAQCHNHRGASWTNSASPPHHSPQYNMLLGTVGELDTGLPPALPASHSRIEKQCAGCHMQTTHAPGAMPADAPGHSLKVQTFDLCRSCHPLPEPLLELTTNAVAYEIENVKAALDLWAVRKAPAGLQSYGARAWEYSSPGELSSGGPGPTAAEQALIPVNIRKARFNLYLVLNDGSFGVHNGPFSITLLSTALGWVEQELNQ